MAKLTFPGVGKPYRAAISNLRTALQMAASYARNSPQAKPEIASQLAVLAQEVGLPVATDGSQAVVSDEDIFVDGDYEVTISVAAGVVTVSVVDTSA